MRPLHTTMISVCVCCRWAVAAQARGSSGSSREGGADAKAGRPRSHVCLKDSWVQIRQLQMLSVPALPPLACKAAVE